MVVFFVYPFPHNLRIPRPKCQVIFHHGEGETSLAFNITSQEEPPLFLFSDTHLQSVIQVNEGLRL